MCKIENSHYITSPIWKPRCGMERTTDGNREFSMSQASTTHSGRSHYTRKSRLKALRSHFFDVIIHQKGCINAPSMRNHPIPSHVSSLQCSNPPLSPVIWVYNALYSLQCNSKTPWEKCPLHSIYFCNAHHVIHAAKSQRI
jgi:hypothetical protein